MNSVSLGARLRALINSTGPISVAEYMATCLGAPHDGYYMRQDPFGAAGDFTTAPEISQLFGEMIGAWCIDTWQRMGRPEKLRLVELGPGRGTLMADLLRVARLQPEFLRATTVHMVETSPRLQAVQQSTLQGAPVPVSWHQRFEDIPEGAVLVVANEFFDALPIHQFVHTPQGWRERVVGIGPDNNQLVFGIGTGRLDPAELPNHLLEPDGQTPEPVILEVSPTGNAIAEQIGSRVVQDGGAALIVDYGYTRSAFGETLQAVQRHAYVNPLADPGSADLTAHVNFAALAGAAAKAGARTHGPVPQGDFLVALGLIERAGALGADKEASLQEQIRADVHRLASPQQMGQLFKVLAITHPMVTPQPFDRRPA